MHLRVALKDEGDKSSDCFPLISFQIIETRKKIKTLCIEAKLSFTRYSTIL